jgi:hypothetical protein
MKAVIGVPSYDGTFDVRFFAELNNLVTYSQSHGVEVSINPESLPVAVGSMIPSNRRRIIESAIKQEADYVLMTDTDSAGIPPDALVRLISYEKELVAALMFGKQPPFLPMSHVHRHPDDKFLTNIVDYPPATLLPVEAVGFGFVVLAIPMVKKLIERRPAGLIFPMSETTGEDVAFCQLARETLQVQPYVDTGLVIGHRGEYIYTDQEYNFFRERVLSLMATGLNIHQVTAQISEQCKENREVTKKEE